MATYYESIYTCPVLAYNKAMRGDYTGMLEKGRYSERKAQAAYAKVFDEYLEEFGLPKAYEEYLRTMIWAAEEYAGSTRSCERWRLTLARAKEHEAIASLGGAPEAFSAVVAKLSRTLGFPIDPARTTVAQFYGYMETM